MLIIVCSINYSAIQTEKFYIKLPNRLPL